MVIVDSHVHVWDKDEQPYPWDPSLGMVPDYLAPLDLLLKTMDQHKVDKAILVQPSNYSYDNRYIAHCLKGHKDSLATIALVDPLREDAPERLEYWVEEHGFQGMRLYPIRNPESRWLNQPSQHRLWRKAEELGVPFTVFIAPTQMRMLEDIASRFTGVKVVVDHMGCPIVGEGPPYKSAQGVLRLAAYPNVYVKLSDMDSASKETHPHKDMHVYAKLLLERFGAHKLMWASNFPHALRRCGYARALSLVAEELPFLTDEDRSWILGQTALSIWEFG